MIPCHGFYLSKLIVGEQVLFYIRLDVGKVVVMEKKLVGAECGFLGSWRFVLFRSHVE